MSTITTTANVPDAVLKACQKILPRNPNGIAFLFSPDFSEVLRLPAERIITDYKITIDTAIEQLRRFLAIKGLAVDEFAVSISPTPLMDELWHALVLDTQVYAKLQQAIGMILHHRPSGAHEREDEARANRVSNMKGRSARIFSSDPIEFSPRQPNYPQRAGLTRKPIVIHVRTLTGVELELSVSNLDAIREVKELVYDKTLIPPGMQRLIFAGKQVADDRILAEYGIDEGALLELVLPLCWSANLELSARS